MNVSSFFGHPWKFLKAYFSSVSPKFGVKHDTQVKSAAKYAKYSSRKRGYFITDIVSPSGVNTSKS